MRTPKSVGIFTRENLLKIVVGAVLLAVPTRFASAQPPPPDAGRLKSKINELIDEIVESEVELDVVLRHSKIVRSKGDILRVAVADPGKVEVVAFGAREIEIIGKETGSTTVTMWIGSEQQSELLSVVVNVRRDESVEDQRRLEYGELQHMINNLFPNSKIQLIPVADKLIVRGEARDEEEVAQIMAILRRNARTTVQGGAFGGGDSGIAQGDASEPFPDAVQLPDSNIVSLLRVPGEKQIMLKVRIAELKRSAIRRLGADFQFDVGDFLFRSTLTGIGNIFASGTFDNDSFNLVLNALAQNGSAKILAEPNLVVISGQPASFISGGEFAVPTVVGVGGAQAATTQFKGFGTQLTFLPTVLDKDRVRMIVRPTFSTLNRDNSVNGIFGLDTRSASTTVDLREGQVLAIAGLLQEQQRGSNSRVPLVGDVPGVNTIFSNKSITRDETELLILVSPELVHPLEPDEAPVILPGMEVTEPDDADFYIFGHIEGRPDCHHRSTVWPIYRDRMKLCRKKYGTYRSSEEYYMSGPIGLSN